MNYTEMFWDANIDELVDGYKAHENGYICLLCGKQTTNGVIYDMDGMLCDAHLYMKKHIMKDHKSPFEHLITLDRKLTGLSERHTQILSLMHKGYSDKDIQQTLGINSLSTVRNHRFAISEKRRQAKLTLALTTMASKSDTKAPKLVEPPITATFIDDRFNVTQVEYDKIVSRFMPKGLDNEIMGFPKKEKQKVILLHEMIKSFEKSKKYTEKEVNKILKIYWNDYVLIRRYLIEYGFMGRLRDCSEYWVK